jgi:hypothetical protein
MNGKTRNPARGKDMPRLYVTGKALDVTVQPVDRRTAIIGNMAAPIRGMSYEFQIQVGNLVYLAKYTSGAMSDRPWAVNEAIDLRFEKERRFLKRPAGKEMEVWLAKTVRISPSGEPPLLL